MIASAESKMSSPIFSGFNQRLPVILQTEAAECGLACLAMVMGYHGYQSDLTSIRHKYSVSAQGTTLKQIMDVATKMDFSTRALKLEVDQLSQLQVPCILHWEMKHFVVLKKVTSKKIIVHDPAFGERTFSLDEVDKLFTGVALELTPTSSFEKGTHQHKLKLSHFWSRITGLKRSLASILILSLFLQIFAIANPYYVQMVIDDVVMRSDINLLTILALGFGLLLILETATSSLRELMILSFSSRLSFQLATNVFRHLIRLPMDYFSKRHIGDVVSRFDSINHVRELLTTGLISVIVDGVLAILTLTVMFFYSLNLTLLILAIVLIYAVFRYISFQTLKRLHAEDLIADANENTHFMESIRAIQTIKLFEKESERQNQWQNRLANALNIDIKIQKWNINFSTANKFLFGLESILVIYFAALAVTQSLMTVGMLFAFIAYKTRFISSIDKLIEKWIEFKMLELHFDRLGDIVHTPTEIAPSNSINGHIQAGEPSNQVKGNIEVRHLSFSYSELDSPVFSDLNFTIAAGQSLAIVGPSGSGKSTLLKCIMGLYPLTDGKILVDSSPISSINNYRSQIAAVMQDDQLLSGSIAENISGFDSSPNIEQIIECAKLACIHEEIMAMNMQYNTLVGDMGSSLSGGQKQRIILARALYSQPSILFLDEATSHLDTENEKNISTNIEKLSITRVIIAHRLETLAAADVVLRLDQGQLEDITSQVKTRS